MSEHIDIQHQQEFYNQYWQGLQPLSSYKVSRAKWIMDVLLQARKAYTENIKLLDLGCGDGRLVPLWQAITGADAHGLELSPQAVETAQNMFPSVHYKQGDATAAGYESNSFDIIICQEVLEHIEQQDQLIAEAARIMKTGGTLILTTPNKYYFDHRKGGNYSTQPIEQIIDKKELFSLLRPRFQVQSYETLIYAKGDYGSYTYLTNQYLLAMLRRLNLEHSWKNRLLKAGYGLHMAVVCKKH